LLDRPDCGRDLGGLAPGEVEESRQDLEGVLHGEHLREFDDTGQAKSTVSQRLNQLGVLLDQPGCDLPVMGGSHRQSKFSMQEPEEVRVSQLGPSSSTVEVGQGDEELGHGAALPGKEFGQAIGEGARGIHAFSIACVPDIARFTLGAPRVTWAAAFC